MASGRDSEEVDLNDTVFVAVGNNAKESQSTLLWAAHIFAGKKICVLHVHQHIHVVDSMNGKNSANKLKHHVDKGCWEHERKTMHELLHQYLLILAQAGAKADKVWIEMDNIQEGIIEMIARYNIRWLVMWAAADKYYSKKMAELKSKKAIFICQHAPLSCHIWFSCKGRLIYTRKGRKDISEVETARSFQLWNTDIDIKQCNDFEPEYDLRNSRLQEEDLDGLEQVLGRISCRGSVHSNTSPNSIFGQSKSTLFPSNEERPLQSLCTRETSEIKEMEEILERENHQIVVIKNQRDGFMKELQMVQDKNSMLENQLLESQCMVKDLEGKIVAAVELLISFKEKRDTLRVELDEVAREQKKLVKMDSEIQYKPQILVFSFLEINEATHNFDLSWKIGEGRFGSVYRGFLRHAHVAIKMLPSYGSQSQFEFECRVDILSKVRHPNLITPIGICPESRSIVYEYLKNESLEDRLSCKDNTPPLLWQTRTRITIELCSALIFLHSSKPCIVHGNLKPSNILLDANFVTKLGDLGISHLAVQSENPCKTTRVCAINGPKTNCVYVDPEYLETGNLTPESDVYSFGIIVLQLLTGRRPSLDIVKEVNCALVMENFIAVLDYSAGDWPLEHAIQLASLGVKCCESNRSNRPSLISEIWSVLETMWGSCLTEGSKAASASCSKETRQIPAHFVCPIFQEMMKDPHIAADGFTYEGEAIRGWLKDGNNRSPMTNLKLNHCNVVPNHALYNAIQDWKHQL